MTKSIYTLNSIKKDKECIRVSLSGRRGVGWIVQITLRYGTLSSGHQPNITMAVNKAAIKLKKYKNDNS